MEELTGSGIEIRYASVITFRTTVTKQSSLEIAGWHRSVDALVGWLDHGMKAVLLPGSGLICQFFRRGRHPRRIERIVAMYVAAIMTYPI